MTGNIDIFLHEYNDEKYTVFNCIEFSDSPDRVVARDIPTIEHANTIVDALNLVENTGTKISYLSAELRDLISQVNTLNEENTRLTKDKKHSLALRDRDIKELKNTNDKLHKIIDSLTKAVKEQHSTLEYAGGLAETVEEEVSQWVSKSSYTEEAPESRCVVNARKLVAALKAGKHDCV